MDIYVYDFDKTVYDGDSTFDFFTYCLKSRPRISKQAPKQIFYGILFLLKIYPKTKFKEKFYSFLKELEDIDSAIEDFWEQHKSKLKAWYLEKPHDSDVIISASPEFLLAPICKELKIQTLIASKVNKKTGKYTGLNCYGKEKVSRLNKKLKDYNILEFYSDSYSDQPLANISQKSFMVKGNKIMEWKNQTR